MKQKGILIIVLTAILAVFFNCAWMPVSHACCKPSAKIQSPQHSGDQAYVCCQDKSAAVTVSVRSSDTQTLDDWTSPPAPQAKTEFLSLIDPRLQSFEGHQFIKDQSRRRYEELCVLLN